MTTLETAKIGIIGLGYVGLPLAVEFGKKYPVVGFDINEKRIADLCSNIDLTLEVSKEELLASSYASFTGDSSRLIDCNVYIVTVPTPIDTFNKPDLSYLYSASKLVGSYLKAGDIVIYESTVYPGCTEDECVPILEASSGLIFKIDFGIGYSPERINPGDKVRTLTKILKIVSGSDKEVLGFLSALYGSIIEAGIYEAPTIQVAEAAKAIENAQRDINISFVNELALMFDRMGIDTNDVLDAASTKWNFLRFSPGLVGGHCIGVDPYYLVHKAQSLGYSPQVISSGRAVNDGMGGFIAKKLLKAMISKGLVLQECRILILGVTFKENCPDTRNTKVVSIYQELKDFGLEVDVYDPWASTTEVKEHYGIAMINYPESKCYDGIIAAVSHKEFKVLEVEKLRKNDKSVVFDVKSIFDRDRVDLRL